MKRELEHHHHHSILAGIGKDEEDVLLSDISSSNTTTNSILRNKKKKKTTNQEEEQEGERKCCSCSSSFLDITPKHDTEEQHKRKNSNNAGRTPLGLKGDQQKISRGRSNLLKLIQLQRQQEVVDNHVRRPSFRQQRSKSVVSSEDVQSLQGASSSPAPSKQTEKIRRIEVEKYLKDRLPQLRQQIQFYKRKYSSSLSNKDDDDDDESKKNNTSPGQCKQTR